MVWTELMRFRIATGREQAGMSTIMNVRGSLKGGECLDFLSDYLFLKGHLVPCSVFNNLVSYSRDPALKSRTRDLLS
jgi:hypothetical protein